MNIYSAKTVNASNEERDRPGPDVLATYVESLKLFLKQNPSLDGTLKKAIENLPPPSSIRSTMSIEEANLLYESVDWAWKQITKNDIVDELKVDKAPEKLMGNYWILKNGVILSGENHFTIIKNNINMFSAILNIGANTILGYMGSDPNKLIGCILNNGGMRVYVNSKKEFYSQISDAAYGEWGRVKVRALDFKSKVVKVIDRKQAYRGWNSGVPVRL